MEIESFALGFDKRRKRKASSPSQSCKRRRVDGIEFGVVNDCLVETALL